MSTVQVEVGRAARVAGGGGSACSGEGGIALGDVRIRSPREPKPQSLLGRVLVQSWTSLDRTSAFFTATRTSAQHERKWSLRCTRTLGADVAPATRTCTRRLCSRAPAAAGSAPLMHRLRGVRARPALGHILVVVGRQQRAPSGWSAKKVRYAPPSLRSPLIFVGRVCSYRADTNLDGVQWRRLRSINSRVATWKLCMFRHMLGLVFVRKPEGTAPPTRRVLKGRRRLEVQNLSSQFTRPSGQLRLRGPRAGGRIRSFEIGDIFVGCCRPLAPGLRWTPACAPHRGRTGYPYRPIVPRPDLVRVLISIRRSRRLYAIIIGTQNSAHVRPNVGTAPVLGNPLCQSHGHPSDESSCYLRARGTSGHIIPSWEAPQDGSEP